MDGVAVIDLLFETLRESVLVKEEQRQEAATQRRAIQINRVNMGVILRMRDPDHVRVVCTKTQDDRQGGNIAHAILPACFSKSRNPAALQQAVNIHKLSADYIQLFLPDT